MNKEIVKQMLKDNFVYKIFHRYHWGNIAPKDAEQSDFHAIDTIAIHRAEYLPDAGDDIAPWEYKPLAQLYFWDAPAEFIQATLLLATTGKITYDGEKDKYPMPTDKDTETYIGMIPVRSSIIFTASLYGRDSGAEYSDPYNDIRITRNCKVGWRDYTSEQWFEHSFGYGSNTWGIANAYIYLIKAFEDGRTPEFTEKEKQTIVGFEVFQHVFKLNWRPITDNRVAGDCISGTWMNIGEGDNTLIADRGDQYEELFHYHYEGIAYAVNYGIYHNGVQIIKDFREFLRDSMGLPKFLIPYICDDVLQMAFYKTWALLPVLQYVTQEKITEFVGLDGGATTNVDCPVGTDTVTVHIPIIFKDGTKRVITVEWNCLDAKPKTVHDLLNDRLIAGHIWNKVEHIQYFGYWIKLKEDLSPVMVSWEDGQALDKLVRE